MNYKPEQFGIPKTLLALAIGLSVQQAQANSPYSGTPVDVPGTVEAENYDVGGPSVAYYDNTAGNTGGAYRSEDVDIEASSTGGFNIGWFEPGEWVEYSINVTSAGTYEIKSLVASGMGGGTLHYEFYGSTTVTSEQVSFGDTGGWQNWVDSPSTTVTLNAGQHVVRVAQIAGGFNINSFTMSQIGGSTSQSPYFGSPFSVPGTIQTENYDIGGEGVAYHDTTGGNTGGAYRSEDVDMEAASHGGHNVGWTEVGEWLEYSIDVSSTGTYDVAALMASGAGGGSIAFEFSGATTVNSAAISIGDTGGWQNWVTSSTTSVNLNAGQHIVRLKVAAGAVNVSDFTLSQAGGTSGILAYDGYTGQYPGYTLVLDERFDSFNSTVWKKGDGAVGGESICRFQPQGVQVVDGNMELVIREEYVPGSWSEDHQAMKGDYNYSCGELRTVPGKRIKYGRIETRMKAPHRDVASGYISSLFTYVHEGDPREWEEIDVELEGGRPDKFQANLIYGVNAADWNATRDWGAWEHKIDVGPVDQWRVFAVEWTPSEIKWYVDGVHYKTLAQDWIDCNPNCVTPQIYYTPIPDNLTELMMNFWIPNDGIQDVFGGNKYRNVYPMTTQYDWVRIYQLDSHPLINY
jgi:endo-1,3-1,4-beta-glycanase ExoK